jgi:hypothetical protein
MHCIGVWTGSLAGANIIYSLPITLLWMTYVLWGLEVCFNQQDPDV